MNDFDYDCLQKKRIARGARNHINARRGKCKLPHEYLSAKERKALNGEVKTYRLNEPMRWAEFKAMPTDIQALYIKALQEKYHANDTMLAAMFGVTKGPVYKCRVSLGVPAIGPRRAARPNEEQMTAWNLWRAGAVAETPVEEPEKPVEEPEKPIQEPMKDVEPAVYQAAPATAWADLKATVHAFRVSFNYVHSWEELYALIKQYPFPEKRAAWIGVEVQ